MRSTLKTAVCGAALACLAGGALAQKGETVKVGHIEPQTGLMGPVGINKARSFQYFAEQFSKNNPAGVKFEMVTFDNKLSPAESLTALKAATDQGIRYIAQGNGSSVAGAGVRSRVGSQRVPASLRSAASISPSRLRSRRLSAHSRETASVSASRTSDLLTRPR